jgi:hypothetical protein
MFKSLDQQIEGLKDAKTLDSVQVEKLKTALSKIKLFTAAASSAKLAKNNRFTKYESYILYMSPASMGYSALNRRGSLCPNASPGCMQACLNTAGRGRFDSVARARLRKALYYIQFTSDFVKHAMAEVSKLRAKVKRGKQLVIRLNGTTDINWIAHRVQGLNIFEMFPDVQFYDYTKNLQYGLKSQTYKNYNITFSASECNAVQWQAALDAGLNVAMVFKSRPEVYHGIKVIDGDLHDLRFLDGNNGSGIIVGLTAKGKAKSDTSGFVVQSCRVLKSA